MITELNIDIVVITCKMICGATYQTRRVVLTDSFAIDLPDGVKEISKAPRSFIAACATDITAFL